MEIGVKVRVVRYTSKLNGREGKIIRTGSCFNKMIGCNLPTFTVELSDGEELLLLHNEFEVIE